jgi:hypothetical protein
MMVVLDAYHLVLVAQAHLLPSMLGFIAWSFRRYAETTQLERELIKDLVSLSAGFPYEADEAQEAVLHNLQKRCVAFVEEFEIDALA